MRPLRPAWMLDATTAGAAVPPVRGRILAARGAEARIDALVKLKALLDAGVLTPGQFAGERDRLLGG